MDTFPKEARFRIPWRPYQEDVLKELENYLDDNNLNVVAAPGSGKTILGLEVMLRLGKPTLILSPTLAIRTQWITRFMELFLATGKQPAWISTDIRKPELLTVVTYQGLYSAFTGIEEETNEIEDTQTEHTSLSMVKSGAIINLLREAGLKTLIVDEAHHLRNAWWKSLIHLKKQFKNIRVVALTATPPYDVSPSEWENYQQLCGPIDAEISVPELVRAGNLCCHRDLVYLNTPSIEETGMIAEFRANMDQFLDNLYSDKTFLEAIREHPVVKNPEENLETLYSNPEYYSSMILFLHAAGEPLPLKLIELMGVAEKLIPVFSREWAEILLKNFLYKDTLIKDTRKLLIKEIRSKLEQYGALEARNVYLRSTPRLDRLLRNSANKLESILKIVKLEYEKMQHSLRMVILTDFIRKEFLESTALNRNRIGVVPIFMNIINRFPQYRRLGILSGSYVVIPEDARDTLVSEATSARIDPAQILTRPVKGIPGFVSVSIKGKDRQKLTQLVTQLFSLGKIEILIGTAALLGEGWDAPSVNTLILASSIGSFMLSNQMRGRAIRIDPNNPGKISNIWHLATIEPGNKNPGHDYNVLKRRFRSFTGISSTDYKITSGLERTGVVKDKFSFEDIRKINDTTFETAIDRKKTAETWKKALENGVLGKITPSLRSVKKSVPHPFILAKTINAILLNGLSWGLVYLYEVSKYAYKEKSNFLKIMLYGFIVITTPFVFKALRLFFRNGPVQGMVKSIGLAVADTLCQYGFFKTDRELIDVLSWKEKNEWGEKTVQCSISGGTSFEKSLFLNCMEEIFNPIENPRYVICRISSRWIGDAEDYHSVPEIFGRKKEYAAYFAEQWKRYIGPTKLVFTRNPEGRHFLLKARQKALSTALQKPSERMDVWR